MYCQNCGSKIPDRAKFCPGCGAPAAGASTATAPATNAPAATKPAVYTPPTNAPGAYAPVAGVQAEQPKKSNKVIIGIVAAVAVIILALVMLPMFGGKSSGGSDSGSASASASASGGTASGDFDPACIDSDGGITLYAVASLSGSELTALLKQQGYEEGNLDWVASNGDRLSLRNELSQDFGIATSDYDSEEYASPGSLTEHGLVFLKTTNFNVADGDADEAVMRELIAALKAMTPKDFEIQKASFSDQLDRIIVIAKTPSLGLAYLEVCPNQEKGVEILLISEGVVGSTEIDEIYDSMLEQDAGWTTIDVDKEFN